MSIFKELLSSLLNESGEVKLPGGVSNSAPIVGDDEVKASSDLPSATPSIDINTATYPDTPDVPSTLRGKPIREGIAQLISVATDKEQLMSTLKENEQLLKDLQSKRSDPDVGLTPEELKLKKERSFIKDPTAFLDKHFEDRIEPLVATYTEQAEALQETLAAQRLKDWSKLGPKVKAIMKTVQPHLRTDPRSWDLAHKIARIDELDRLESEFTVRHGYHVESGDIGSPPKPPEKVVLSDEEKRVASEFGMTAEEYVKWSKPDAGIES